jgi:hypothetical protein
VVYITCRRRRRKQIIGASRAFLAWAPPTQGVMKINIDTFVAKTENKGAVNAICGNNPEILEALSCANAMCPATDLQLNTIKISFDCLSVVK